MNAKPLPTPERGLILLVAIALLASGVILYVGQERPAAALHSEPIVLENVRVIRPTFHDARTLDLNTAPIEELVRLPGIGPVLGERIIAYREEHGRFTAIDELLAVNGIGPKVLEEIREQVTIGAEEDRTAADQ
jgi:comEA protein